MSDYDPPTRAEYDAKFHKNNRMSGYGLEVTVHMPCPFCAEADWLVAKVLDSESAMTKSTTCTKCGRSCQGIVKRDRGMTQLSFVQTGGEDPPSYLPPIPRAAP